MESRLLLARAHLLRKSEKEADAALSGFEKLASGFAPTDVTTDLRAEAGLLRGLVKNAECAQLPGRGPLDEGQYQALLERKGLCMKEAALQLIPASKLDKSSFREETIQTIDGMIADYQKACENPPTPPGKRTARELHQYLAETKAMVQSLCNRQLSEVNDLRKL